MYGLTHFNGGGINEKGALKKATDIIKTFERDYEHMVPGLKIDIEKTSMNFTLKVYGDDIENGKVIAYMILLCLSYQIKEEIPNISSSTIFN